MLHEQGIVFPPHGCPLPLLPKTRACTHMHTLEACLASPQACGVTSPSLRGGHGSNTVKCHFAVAHRGSGLLQGLIHAGGEQESQWKVRPRGPRRQFTAPALIFDPSQMCWCDCLPRFCKREIKASKGFAFQRRQMSSTNTQNGQQTHTVCANEITTKHCEFGSAVLERLLQAIVAKQQLPMIELKVNVSVGNLERAQRTTKVYLELNTLILLEDVAVEGKDACRTKTERSSISRLSSTTSEA